MFASIITNNKQNNQILYKRYIHDYDVTAVYNVPHFLIDCDEITLDVQQQRGNLL